MNVASHQNSHYTWNCNARRTSTYYDTDTQHPSLVSSKPCYERQHGDKWSYPGFSTAEMSAASYNFH